MHIVENKTKAGKKIYQSILLRESYREDGKVKKRTVGNLSNCSVGEIAAIKLALKYKDNLTALATLASLSDSIQLQEGLSIGAVFAVYQVAKGLGIETVLGTDFAGKLALWQVIARVIDQGSRLSAVRLAKTHAIADVLNLTRGFDENDLYDNLKWLAKNKERIEQELLGLRRSGSKPKLFLYDVTSSYLEGEQNYFAKFGYNRDGKKGKQQLVIGLLCDEMGEAVSIEAFAGNTQDPKTVGSQVKKIAEQFGCGEVTLVGDRGMIKSTQIAELPEYFHYITAITKPQIETLVKKGVIQYELFDSVLGEIKDDHVRYIFRRNPIRAEEIVTGRQSKLNSMAKLVVVKNIYLEEHPKAKVETALKAVAARLKKLKIDEWLDVQAEGRVLRLVKNETALEQMALLDGCYVIKTDLTREMAEKEVVHDRYKDLAQVEKAFREMKTVNLEVRPVYVWKEQSTIGHVEIVMLSYMIIRRLQQAWAKFDLTVAEGLKQLETLCITEIRVNDKKTALKIPQPREVSQKLLAALELRLPEIVVPRKVNVVTRKKLPRKRKNP